jgi:hypothetical protein
MSSDNYLHIVTQDSVSNEKIRLGRLLMWSSVGLFFLHGSLANIAGIWCH